MQTRLLRDLSHDRMLKVAKALTREVLHEGQTVIKQVSAQEVMFPSG